MAITLKHITMGQLGLQADSGQALHQAVHTLTAAGYQVTDIEDDADEPWHVALIHYQGPQAVRTIQELLGVPGAYRNRK